MANINTNLRLYSQGSSIQNLGFYNFGTTSYSGSYYHFKTNDRLELYNMIRVEAVGSNYSQSAPIRCAWVWYTYTYLANVGLQNIYTGLEANGVYMSSDGYVCFRSYTPNAGDVSFSLNLLTANPNGVNFNLQITAVNQNSTSGNHY